jgi:hypothetical protein
LVYYDVYWSRATLTIVPFGELEFHFNRFAALVGGYSGQQKSTANVQTGYDKYDALSNYGDQKLASVTSDGSLYGGLKIAVIGSPPLHLIGLDIGSTRIKSQ